MSYRGYTDEQVLEISNGCGGQKGLARWMKPPHAKFFKPDCDKHDVDYEIGGTEKDRKGADFALKIRMTARIKSKTKQELVAEMYGAECGIPDWAVSYLPNSVIIKIFYLWTVFYYKMVQKCGRLFFNYHD